MATRHADWRRKKRGHQWPRVTVGAEDKGSIVRVLALPSQCQEPKVQVALAAWNRAGSKPYVTGSSTLSVCSHDQTSFFILHLTLLHFLRGPVHRSAGDLTTTLDYASPALFPRTYSIPALYYFLFIIPSSHSFTPLLLFARLLRHSHSR